MATIVATKGKDWRASLLVQWILANPLLVAGMAAIAIPTMMYVAKSSWSTEQGAHGPIVMAAGLWLLIRQAKTAIAHRESPPTGRVLLLFFPLLIGYFLARTTEIVEVEGYLMYALLVTAIYATVGGRVLKLLWFPILFLLFVFPPPDTLVAAVTQPLKIALSQLSIKMLYGLGYPIAGAGVTIQIGQYQLFVAEACSGLNSLISLSAISLFYVYIRHEADWRYALMLMICVVPVAIFANFVRIIILVLITYYGGDAMAQGFLHGFAGIFMFMTALLSIFALDSIAQPIWKRFTLKASRP
jgi:exosortase